MKYNTNNAFAKHLSTAFIVGTPFQLLCALEAIHSFEIDDYKFVFVLNKGWKRNDQTLSIAEQLNITYDLIWFGNKEDEYFDWTKGDFLIQAQGRYDRIFIADYHGAYYHIIVPFYGHKGSLIAYLDDGNSTILFLKGILFDKKPSEWRKLIRWYRKRKQVVELYRQQAVIKALESMGIYSSQSFFTTYWNIKNTSHLVYANSLSYTKQLYENTIKKCRVILIIGTVLDAYADDNLITERTAEGLVWKSLAEIRDKHKDENLIYIPHGRDSGCITSKFCKILNIDFLPISETIETYILKSEIQPIAIYGYGSTALYNFHLIYPQIEIVNLVVGEKSKYGVDKQNIAINRYYEEVGIRIQTMWINKKNITNYISVGSNIKSLLQIITDRLKNYNLYNID